MKKQHWGVALILIVVLGGLSAALWLFVKDPVVLQPSGDVAIQQRNLMYLAVIIMSVVVLPVFGLLFFIAWKYRATNTKSKYTPKWDNHRGLESIWWGIPIVIVIILSFIAWQTSHSLDPFRKLDSDVKPIKVQVVALQWKWLFIYPEQRVASVNELVIPEKTPINFSIASDAPMNSFWIPELGGQIYAMSGMNTQLHLVADRTGEFKGVSSNISGEGFADMKFTVRSVRSDEFTSWWQKLAGNDTPADHLEMTSYDQLAKPSILPKPQYYHLHDSNLYQKIIEKYTMPHSTGEMSHDMQHNDGGAH
ncbi:MAG: ubiquinol oxidase subunit II [Candidatus Saccharimonadales bacterium]